MDTLLARVADSLGAAQNLEHLARPLLEVLHGISGLEAVYLTEVDEVAGQQRVLFVHDGGKPCIDEGLSVPWEDTLCRRALASGQRYTDDVPGRWPDSEAARALGIVTYLTEPVYLADGSLFGTLCGISDRPVDRSDGNARMVALFARLLGQQVDRESLLRRLREHNAELSSRAMTDPLTGLANRRMLEEELRRTLARLERDGGEVDLAFVDFDGFKAINDRYGHEAGDRLLVAMASRLTEGLRGSDLIARYGGDEFVVMSGVREASTERESATLQSRVEALTRGRLELGGLNFDYAGASVGVIRIGAGAGTADQVLARADAAMYARKQQRRADQATRH
ncbi:GGDEF domain-containing protein [Pseudomarimonas salicorniae]|uniref:diguanylate cyclase n=1 Tax=Pseudomarimonas salicorniae TaxID=2933270 RepID=A0ABT0GKG1_9GAMM|nr:sensor domain-containing diguanylate cyclase [Lysobacter sp. CAU 1642]MCK7595029.1 sensor domain-containing diguanylate cyclase [Lysobacter sp. CAU 1642]